MSSEGSKYMEITKEKFEIFLSNLDSNDFLEGLEVQYFSEADEVGFSSLRIGNIFKVTCNFPKDMLSWDKPISMNKFNELLIDYCLDRTELHLETALDAYSEKIYDIFISYDFNYNIKINESIGYIINKFSEISNEILNSKKIENSIIFSPEHLTAGSSILQYFGKLLQEKYPDEKVSVSIRQEALKVTMLIETPDGKKEEIEEYLNQYSLVITNQISPEEFTSNQIQVLELKTKLEAAKMEIGFQKKLLALQDKTYDENLISLKDEVMFLREELSGIRKSNNKNISILLTSLLNKDKLIKKLIKSVSKSDGKETKQLLLELKEKEVKGYTSLKEHVDNIIVGNLTNTPAWMEFLITHFPK
jgi:hypothetical protein